MHLLDGHDLGLIDVRYSNMESDRISVRCGAEYTSDGKGYN